MGKGEKPGGGAPEKAPHPKPEPAPEPNPAPKPAADPLPVGEPVSVTNGEYLETWRDFLIPGTLGFDGARYMGLKLALPSGYTSPLGPCQISMFDEVFSNPARGKLQFHNADGKAIAFDRPFNFLPSINAAYPNLELKAPWLKQLELKDRGIVKHFRQYDDDVYRLEKIEDLNGNSMTFHRSDAGWLERVEGPDGLSLSFDNDAQGQRLRIRLISTDGSELELARYSYDAKGRMVEATCAFGMSVHYVWERDRDLLVSWNNLTRQSETHFTYDDDGRVVRTRTNGIWNNDRFDYREGETRYLPGGVEAEAQTFRYDENENVTAEVDALGGVVAHSYDRHGFRISTKNQNGHESRTRYDVNGNVKELTDPEGRSTVYGWGDNGELLIAIDGAGNKRIYKHDDHGNVISEKDAEGHETRLVRDARGRVVETHFPNGAIERRNWDEHNRLIAITDAKGNTSRFAHDAFGRLVETIGPTGAVTRHVYRAGAGGFDTVSAVIRPDGVQVTRSFDGAGQLASVSDGEGRMWHYRYGAFGVLQAIVDPKGGELKLATDNEGRVISVTNAVGRVYSFERDAAGRVVVEEDFDDRVWHYARDAAGQIVETTKPDGAKLHYAYDKSGLIKRIETVTDKGEPEDVTRFWYDARGLLISAENTAALVEFERDRNGRIIGESLNGKRIKSKRDAMGNRILREITGAGGSLTQYIRDPLGAVEQLVAGDTEISFKRDVLGRETERRMGGFHLLQRFDAAGQLTAQAAGPAIAGGLDVSRLGWNIPGGGGDRSARAKPGHIHRIFEYDRAFAPVSIDDGLWGKRQFTYDDNGQLTDSEAAFGSERYQYDEARNLAGASSSVTIAEQPTPYGRAFDETFGSTVPAPKPNGWQRSAGGVVQVAKGPKGEKIQLTHDDCGRLIERRVERDGFRPQRWRYRWDVHDRLVGVTTLEGEEWLFRYDPFGRRVCKVRRFAEQDRHRAALRWPSLIGGDGVPRPARSGSDAQTRDHDLPDVGTTYLWDGDHMVAEAPLFLDGHIAWDEATHWHFEEGSHRLLAKQLPSGEMLAIVSDHLGTPKEMFDAKGTLIWAADHHVWGAVRTTKTFGALAALPRHDRPPEELQCPWRFPGQYEDTETGLCYNRHRHYDPLTGQYASPDPIGLAGGDRPQGYVSNPNTLVDVLGLSSTSGNATLHWYDNRDPTNSTGHWAIETEFDGNKILTHQLGAPGYNTLIDDTIDMVPTKSSVVVLPDAKTAQAFQRSQIGKDLGEYNIKTRSCQTHLCEVLQSGGVDAPDNPIKFNRYLKDLGVYPPSNK
ncbi:RHS repeat protein [Agrobacterium vitis]|nr:RHS repeat protein [Allorhizobium ampelinum]